MTSTVELALYRRLVRRHLKLAGLTALAGLAIGLGVTWLTPPIYVSHVTVLTPTTPAYLDLRLDTRAHDSGPPPRAWTQDTEAELIRSDLVLGRVAERLSRATHSTAPEAWTAAKVRERIRLSVPANSRIFSIEFVGDSAAQARTGAQAVADEYVRQRSALIADHAHRVRDALNKRRVTLQNVLQGEEPLSGSTADDSDDSTDQPTLPSSPEVRGELREQIARIDDAIAKVDATTSERASIVRRATLPDRPTRHNAEVAPVSGLAAGFGAGLAAGYLRRRRRRVLQDTLDIADASGLPVVAVVDVAAIRDGDRGLTDAVGQRLAARLDSVCDGKPVVLVRCSTELVGEELATYVRRVAPHMQVEATSLVAGPHAYEGVVIVAVQLARTTRRELVRTIRAIRASSAIRASHGSPAGMTPVVGVIALTGGP
ncbi:MAG TPA: hypothetical protein VIL34_14240 [Actinopolymorphaceae bacterium]|jgi:capsular polysaccharide biosynthesis protein